MKTLYFHPERGAVRVRDGFSWSAFLFGALWAAAHHLWLPVFVVLLSIEFLAMFSGARAEAIGNPGMAILAATALFAYRIICGTYGNRWLTNHLIKLGYQPMGGEDALHPHARELRPLWNPETAASLSLLFTPIFGTYLHMRNWEALNEPDRAQGARYWFYGAAVVTLLTFAGQAFAASWGGSLIPLAGAYLLTWYFAAARAQAKYLKENFDNDYVRRSWKQPLLWVGALFLGLIAASVVAGMVVDIITGLWHWQDQGRRVR